MIIENKLNLPQAIVEACTTERHNAADCISATTIIKGAKEIILTDRHWDGLKDDASDRIWAVLGTAVHALLQSKDKDNFTEERFEYKIGGKTITGQVDLYNMKLEEIDDYKTASVYKIINRDFDDWRAQGLIYAFLLRKAGLEVNKCRFVSMLKDFSQSKAKVDSSYPQSPIYIFEFDVTDALMESTETWLTEKVRQIEDCEKLNDDDIPECSEKERWQSETVYAVYKNQNKTATKLFYTNNFQSASEASDAAEQFAESLEDAKTTTRVEERLGEAKKCEGYCVCKEFCSFYKKNHKE